MMGGQGRLQGYRWNGFLRLYVASPDPGRDVCADVMVPTQTLAAVSACGRGYGGTDPFIMRSEYITQPAACHHQLHLHAARP